MLNDHILFMHAFMFVATNIFVLQYYVNSIAYWQNIG